MPAPVGAAVETLEQAGRAAFRRKAGNSSGGMFHRKQKKQKRKPKPSNRWRYIMPSLASFGKRAMSAGRSVSRGAASFAGHQGGRSFSSMGKFRMGAAAGAGIGMARHNNARRGGYIPKSSATQGLQPKSSGGAGRFDYQ